MDWSKAKTILIIALLIVCLILGGILLQRDLVSRRQDKDALLLCMEYLEDSGVLLQTEIPLERPKLPVLFVKRVLEQQENSEEVIFDGYPLETSVGQSASYSITGHGKSRAKVVSASSAVLKAVSEMGAFRIGAEIEKVELIYYVDVIMYGDISSGTDTAVPAWKIQSSAGDFYISAYAQ